MLWLKQDQAHAKRRAEARIGLLREVIERVQRGEEVDVGKALGSGDKGREEEWAESKYSQRRRSLELGDKVRIG